MAGDEDLALRGASEADTDEGWPWAGVDFASDSHHGMDEEDVSALPSRALTSREDIDMLICVVCQEEFETNDRVMELSCSHVFHQACLEQWLVVTAKCPTCKRTVEPPASS